MKTFILLLALVSTNAFAASQKAADLYQILKEAGLSEMGNGVFHMDQEKIMGIACQKKNDGTASCGLDRDDKDGNMIRVTGANGLKMFELLAPAKYTCNEKYCGFFVDAVQCDYYLANEVPMSKRTQCQITRTDSLEDF